MKQITDVIQYFSQFVAKSAVTKLLAKNSAAGGYADISSILNNVVDENRNSEITDFILGINEETVNKIISQVKGYYLFVDFGNISSILSETRAKFDELRLAITVAKPLSTNSFNNIEEMLVLEKALDIIAGIRRKMREDTDDRMTYPLLEQLVWPNEISPFYARDLSASIGWSMMFSRKGIDMI